MPTKSIIPNDIAKSMPVEAGQRGIEPHIWSAMRQAYKASDQMLLTLWDYCAARGLDIVKKPCWIVPTWDAETRRMSETIWEGIGSFRITAARTGQYAGADEPIFGPDVTNWNIVYPEWCKFTVHRMIGGTRCPFTVVVRWLEHYASKKDGAPNAMWVKRPYGQLAKCAEAQALRSAFPEEIGSAPAAEEIGEAESLSGSEIVDVTPVHEGARPKREDFDEQPAAAPAVYELIDEVGEVVGEFEAHEFDKKLGKLIAATAPRSLLEQLWLNNDSTLELMKASDESQRANDIREYYAATHAKILAGEEAQDSPPTELIWLSSNGRENRIVGLEKWVASVKGALGRCQDVGMLQTSRQKNAARLAEYSAYGGSFSEAVLAVEAEFDAVKVKLTGAETTLTP